MSSCWNEHPNERPTFTEILQKIDAMFKDFSIQTKNNTNETKTKTETTTSGTDEVEKLNKLNCLGQQNRWVCKNLETTYST